MSRDQRDGQLAYDTYATATGGKTHDGRPMPTWDELPERIRAAWAAAACAVRGRAVRDGGGL